MGHPQVCKQACEPDLLRVPHKPQLLQVDASEHWWQEGGKALTQDVIVWYPVCQPCTSAFVHACCTDGPDESCTLCMQARAEAAEEALAAAKVAAEQERAELQGQADESRTVVGQWKEAYEKLNSQYEGIQVIRPCTLHGFVSVSFQTDSLKTFQASQIDDSCL